MNKQTTTRSIAEVLSDGLGTAFKTEKADLYKHFGPRWIASADLWETDMLCVLWAFSDEKTKNNINLYDFNSIGEDVKLHLDETAKHFKYVAFLLLTEIVVRELVGE